MVRQVFWWLRLALRSARRALRASGSRRAGHRVSDGTRGGNGRAAVRVLALLAVASALAACAGAKAAFATVIWGSQDEEMAAVVYPHDWSTNGRNAAAAEFLGFDWSLLTSAQQDAILNGNNGDNLFRSIASIVHTRNVFFEGIDFEPEVSVDDPINVILQTLYDSNSVINAVFNGEIWACYATSGMYNDAREYYLSALGISLVGGDGGINVDDEGYFEVNLTFNDITAIVRDVPSKQVYPYTFLVDGMRYCFIPI